MASVSFRTFFSRGSFLMVKFRTTLRNVLVAVKYFKELVIEFFFIGAVDSETAADKVWIRSFTLT